MMFPVSAPARFPHVCTCRTTLSPSLSSTHRYSYTHTHTHTHTLTHKHTHAHLHAHSHPRHTQTRTFGSEHGCNNQRSVTHLGPGPRASSPTTKEAAAGSGRGSGSARGCGSNQRGPLSLTNIINTLAPLLPRRELGLRERRCVTEAA